LQQDRTPGLPQIGFAQGLIPIPRPLPIPRPIPVPTSNPVQNPEPLPRPSVLPGTSTVDQYSVSRSTLPAATGQTSYLTTQGTPAIGQYLRPEEAPSQGTRDAARAEATRRRLTAPTGQPRTVASNQINLPAPERFWRRTAASRRVTLPRPRDIWRGMPTTSQISLPNPEEFWRR
jgi:hypothetical protein